jgi:peptidoglycan hydrolase-like protein with peptidoglycan-binding domain
VIYRYDDGTWTALTDCSRDTTAKTVTCKTTHFSDFALIGEASASSGSGSTSAAGGDLISVGNGNWRYASGVLFGSSTPPSTSSQTPASPTTPSPFASFTKNLKVGMTDSEVLSLQKFLNTNGFTITSSGAGSIGNETTTFGRMTANALAKFQKAHGITPASGYFGPTTRAYVNTFSGTRLPSTPQTPTPSSSSLPTVDLELGSKGEDVKKLQTFLISKGYVLSAGVTGYFGPQTKAALIQFQKDAGITPASGYYGGRTRAKANAGL